MNQKGGQQQLQRIYQQRNNDHPVQTTITKTKRHFFSSPLKFKPPAEDTGIKAVSSVIIGALENAFFW
jgi:hypothetical protein